MKRITVVGSMNIDLVLPVERMPCPGETLAGGDLAWFEGGKGANQACAAGRLGGLVTMIGQVGTDPFAARLVGALRASGVDTSGIGTSPRPTGCACICLLPGGENAIVVSPGANATLTAEMAVKRLAMAAPYSFLLGQLETPMGTIVAAFTEAKRAGATTILDPAPALDLPAELIALIDFITPNQIEAGTLLGRTEGRIRNFEDARRAANDLMDAGYRGVVLKLGPIGCYVAARGLRAGVPAFEVSAVDTTAAGDTFNAAFAVSLAQGAPLVEAALFANGAAGISVTRPGAQNSIPTRAEVETLLSLRRPAVCSL